MRLFSKIVLHYMNKISAKKKSHKPDYIFYKIVGLRDNNTQYTLQCICTNTIFYATILDIVTDKTLLYALHPIQACYVGIEYASFLRNQEQSSLASQNNPPTEIPSDISRYGKYHCTHHDRKGNIGFIEKNTGEMQLMHPGEIACSDNLIEEFDASQAFYIGVSAGFKFTIEKSFLNQRPLLSIVK